MFRKATKNEHERLEDESSRLVRPAPKDRPPRHDRRRERVHLEDDDPDEKADQKDCSRNRKDVGGSSHFSFPGRDFIYPLDRTMARGSDPRAPGETVMRKLSAEQSKNASTILGHLDRMAGYIQNHYAGLGLEFDEAKKVVNALDACADDLELSIFGKESLDTRRQEVQAAVIESDPAQPYVKTFDNPQEPHQTDADAPYMSQFSTDGTTEVGEGEDETGDPLAPEYS